MKNLTWCDDFLYIIFQQGLNKDMYLSLIVLFSGKKKLNQNKKKTFQKCNNNFQTGYM